MCFDLSNQAKQVSVANSTQRALLTRYADTAFSKTGLTWHGQESNADFAGCSTDTIRRRIRELEDSGDISCFRIPGKTTLVLVHPGDAEGCFKRKKLSWKTVAEHLKKSPYSAATKVDIANWLFQIGWLQECEAIEALLEYEAKCSKKKQRNATARFEPTPRNLQGHPPQTAETDHANSGRSASKLRDEYKNNNIKNETTNLGNDNARHLAADTGAVENSEPADALIPLADATIQPLKAENHEAVNDDQIERVKWILDGRKRFIDTGQLFVCDPTSAA